MSQSKKLEPIHAEVIAFLWLVCLGGKVLDGQIILGTSTVRASPVYIGKLGTLRSPFVQRCLTYCFLNFLELVYFFRADTFSIFLFILHYRYAMLYIQLAWQGRFRILRKLDITGMKIQNMQGGQTQG